VQSSLKVLYDAIELLRRLNLLLSIPMVEGTAKLLIQKRGCGWLWQWLSIKKVIGHLQQTEEILRPRDGQIEAKKTQNVVLDLYLPGVLKLLAQMKSQYSVELFAAEFLNCGSSLSALGRNDEAIASYEQSLKFKPDLHDAWNNRGVSLSALGRNDEAIASYEQSLKFKPDLHDTWNNRGNSLSALGRNEEAIASYDQAIEIKPDDHDAWYNRGISLSALGRKEKAIASYDQAIEIKPDDHEAWNNRGVSLSALGRKEDAIASYDRSIAIKPDDASAFYNKACCYGLQSQVELAVDCLQRAIELAPKYQDMAKTDTDFDSIRGSDRFQALIEH